MHCTNLYFYCRQRLRLQLLHFAKTNRTIWRQKQKAAHKWKNKLRSLIYVNDTRRALILHWSSLKLKPLASTECISMCLYWASVSECALGIVFHQSVPIYLWHWHIRRHTKCPSEQLLHRYLLFCHYTHRGECSHFYFRRFSAAVSLSVLYNFEHFFFSLDSLYLLLLRLFQSFILQQHLRLRFLHLRCLHAPVHIIDIGYVLTFFNLSWSELHLRIQHTVIKIGLPFSLSSACRKIIIIIMHYY